MTQSTAPSCVSARAAARWRWCRRGRCARGWPRRSGRAEEAIELVVIRTTGDAIQDRPLAEVGGKGLFTKEIEEALLDGRIDLAVHSAKDMPTFLPAGLMLAACLEREDPRDVFISRKAGSLADLPQGATLGTASPRRQAIAKRARPDLRIVPLRGNVETRLRKLDAGEVDATILALAGLKRLGLDAHATKIMSVEEFLPAVGQGAIGIETRADDTRTRDIAGAHRSCRYLDGAVPASARSSPCSTAPARRRSAATRRYPATRLHFRGLIARPDGSRRARHRRCRPRARRGQDRHRGRPRY